MDPMDLPMGFGMALLQNEQATRTFYALSPARQRELLQKTQTVSSKAEMRALVNSLTAPGGGTTLTM